MRKLLLAAVLATAMPATVEAAPARTAHPPARSEALNGRGSVWIGALAFLLAAAVVFIGYSHSGDGPPASP
jgi:type VI protein secretion system component VasF